MDFTWTSHRFAGGALALDVANTVILRFDPERSIDRLAVPEQLDAFPTAANAFCGERLVFGPLRPIVWKDQTDFLAMREAIDRYFRGRVLTIDDPALLADLLERLASMLRRSMSEADLGTSTARSALRLLSLPEDGRMKICPKCGWLFLDRSKNRSRAWCDMAVCGNRTKVNRHYSRRKQEASP